MSTENPDEQLPRNPEQKEWQGQRWEYLAVEVIQFGGRLHFLDRQRTEGIKGKPSPDPFVERYKKMIEEQRKKISGQSVRDELNLLGNEGWETVGIATREGFTVVLLKRPLAASQL